MKSRPRQNAATLSDKVNLDRDELFSSPATLSAPFRGADSTRSLRGDYRDNLTRSTRSGRSEQLNLGLKLETWDVHAFDLVFGVGKRLDRFQAVTRSKAEEIARGKHGRAILVTIASNAKPQRKRPT